MTAFEWVTIAIASAGLILKGIALFRDERSEKAVARKKYRRPRK